MRTFLALLLLAFGTAACTTDDASSPTLPPADTVRVTDALGRQVALPAAPDRVVSLAPNLTEIIYAAGAGPRLAAVTTADDFPPAVDSLPKVGALPVDFEAIVAHDPDLILATDQVNTQRDADTFASLDVPVYFFQFATVQDVFDAVRTTGRLLGSPAAAADSADALATQLNAVQTATENVDDRPRVLVLVGDETLYAFGAQSYVHTLVEAAGGQSVTADLDARAPTLSEEYVLTEKPDVIVGAWGADYDPDRLLELHPTWDVVPAVANDRVISLPAAWLLRPGPRLVAGARALAARLHPSRADRLPPMPPALRLDSEPGE